MIPTTMSTERSAAGARSRAGRARGTGRASGAIRICLFDECELTEDGEHRPLPRAVCRLLALLALNREGLSRSDAPALLTPHLSTQGARGSLRKTLTRLRATGLDVAEVDGATLRLAPGVRVDAWELEELVAGLAAESVSPGHEHFRRLAPWHLPRWYPPWLRAELERLRDFVLEALEADARRAAASGDVERALTAAFAAVEIDPLRESSVGLLLQMLRLEGHHTGVLEIYRSFYRSLEAVGRAPSEATQALVAPMLGSAYWKRLESRAGGRRRRARH